MRTSYGLCFLIAAFSVPAVAASAFATELPKEGSYDYTACWSGVINTVRTPSARANGAIAATFTTETTSATSRCAPWVRLSRCNRLEPATRPLRALADWEASLIMLRFRLSSIAF